MSVVDWTGTLIDWQVALKGLKELIASAFGRREQRQSAGAFIVGVLSGAERKTEWMLAEEAGLGCLYRIQSLPGRSSWSVDELCRLVRRHAINTLGRCGRGAGGG